MREERNLMRKRILLLVAALMLTLTMAFGSVAAFAAPAEEECRAAGGTYTQVSQSGPVKYQCVFTTQTNPSGNDNPNAATPFTETDSEGGPGQGGGGGAEEDNPNFEEQQGPKTNRGGGTPGGQQ